MAMRADAFHPVNARIHETQLVDMAASRIIETKIAGRVGKIHLDGSDAVVKTSVQGRKIQAIHNSQ